jgi:hypothetical protein
MLPGSFGWLVGRQEEPSLDGRSNEELMAVCEAHWQALEAPDSAGRSVSPEALEGFNRYVAASNALSERGPEVVTWARGLLTHPLYEARESGALLLGRLGQRGVLGEARAAIVAELGALANRPAAADDKDLQANDCAIMALGMIGDPGAIRPLRQILFSPRNDPESDPHWTAAEALGQIVKEPFVDSNDPIDAAKAWLHAHPDDEP